MEGLMQLINGISKTAHSSPDYILSIGKHFSHFGSDNIPCIFLPPHFLIFIIILNY